MRRGRQLEVTVRWAGVNPLFGCAWGDSVLAITDLTPDLRRQARTMEREMYPEAPVARPPPLRIQGRRGRGGGSDLSRAETTPPNKQARPLGHRAKAGVVSVDSC